MHIILTTGYKMLFIYPGLGCRVPVTQFFILEPQSNLLLSTFHRVRAMDNVASDFNTQVTTDGSRGRFKLEEREMFNSNYGLMM